MASTTNREYREGLDTVLLITAFIVGVGSAVILKVMGFPPYIPAIAAGAVIIVYGVATYKSSVARLESEQIGDNCYYLGFCITLASLAYTLYSLGSAGSNAAILGDVISGFGVALSSTVVGVMARVVLLQFRVDLTARDKEARGQLNQVMRSFHSEMQTSVSSTRETIVQIRQTLEEHTEATIENNKRMQESYETRIEALVEEAVGGVKAAMYEVVESGKDMNKRLSASSRANMATAEKAMTDSIETITGNLRRATETLEAEMKLANARSVKSLEKIVMEVSAAMKLTSEEASKAIATSCEQQNTEMTKAVESVATQIGEQKEKIGAALEDYTTETRAVRQEVRRSAQIVTVATQKMTWAAEKIEKSTQAAIPAATPQAGQPLGSQVLAGQALPVGPSPTSLATTATPAAAGTQRDAGLNGEAALAGVPDATSAGTPTLSGDAQTPEQITPTAPVTQSQLSTEPERLASPPVSDSDRPSTSATGSSKSARWGFRKLFRSQ